MFRRNRRELDDATVADLTRFALPEHHDDLKRLAERKGFFQAAIDDASGRFFMADAEDLAEGGAAEFLGTLAAPLAALDASFGSIAEGDFDGESQTVIVDGVPRSIYTETELARGEKWASWTLATVRTFGLVNERLAAVESPERLYAIMGGNDLQAVFLTERLAAALAAEVDSQDRPYLPTEDDPEGTRQRA